MIFVKINKYPYLLYAFIVLTLACTNREPIRQASTRNGTSKIDRLDSLVKLTDSLILSQKAEIAKPIIDSLIRTDSSVGLLHFKRGNCNMQLMNFEEAISDYEKASQHGY